MAAGKSRRKAHTITKTNLKRHLYKLVRLNLRARGHAARTDKRRVMKGLAVQEKENSKQDSNVAVEEEEWVECGKCKQWWTLERGVKTWGDAPLEYEQVTWSTYSSCNVQQEVAQR